MILLPPVFLKTNLLLLLHSRYGEPVELSQSLREICDSCLAKAVISPADKERFKFFAFAGDEPTYFGYTSLKNFSPTAGVYIGLPYFFEFKSPKDIDTSNLSVWVDDAIPWSTNNGQKLLDSLVMSEDAIKFVIMRQIYMTNSFAPQLIFANLATCFAMNWMLSRTIVKMFTKTPYTSLPLGLRVMIKTIQVVLCASIFVIVRDFIRHACETQSDLRAVEHGDDFYEGAIEFYSKLLKRNKAFSFFLGDEGRHYYTSSGDPKPPLYHKYFKPISMVPSARIANIQQRFGHYIAKDEPISN